MAVRIEKDGPVWTVIHSRQEARNAMKPESAKALYEAFRAFDADDNASVAVFWGEGGAFCAGWDLKHVAGLAGANALDPLVFPKRANPRWRQWVQVGWSYPSPSLQLFQAQQ